MPFKRERQNPLLLMIDKKSGPSSQAKMGTNSFKSFGESKADGLFNVTRQQKGDGEERVGLGGREWGGLV